MGCAGTCSITEIRYLDPTVSFVDGVTPNAPSIDAKDPEAKLILEAVARNQATYVTGGCEDGCLCLPNRFQPNVPRDQPQTADNVPWEEDRVSIRGHLIRGNFAYDVHGLVTIRQRTLAGHCVPSLVAAVDAPGTATVSFGLPTIGFTTPVPGYFLPLRPKGFTEMMGDLPLPPAEPRKTPPVGPEPPQPKPPHKKAPHAPRKPRSMPR
jgi:hypothetical protein